MIGAPLDTMSILHHAEHLAQVPGKRVRRIEIPLQTSGEGQQGLLGAAPSVLVRAADIVAFTVRWLEQRFG